MGLKFIAFDAFGTLVFIKQPLSGNPYQPILEALEIDSRIFRELCLKRPEPLEVVLSELVGRNQVLKHLHLIRELETSVLQEAATVSPFLDTLPTLRALREHGIKYGIVSNLARSYGPAVVKALGELSPDICIWSYEVGAIKPEPEIYMRYCERMGCKPNETLFVGDRERNDLTVPLAIGFQARQIVRDADHPTSPLQVGNLHEIIPLLELNPRTPTAGALLQDRPEEFKRFR